MDNLAIDRDCFLNPECHYDGVKSVQIFIIVNVLNDPNNFSYSDHLGHLQ